MKKTVAGAILAVGLMLTGAVATLNGGAYAKAVKSTDPGAYKCPDDSVNEEFQGKYTDNPTECNVSNTAAGATDLFGTIRTIVNVVLSVLGLITVAMIVIGGVNYTTSQGDPGRTKKAKDTIMYGIIGLVIAMLAFAIVNFVLANVFKNSSSTSDADKAAQKACELNNGNWNAETKTCTDNSGNETETEEI